MSMRAVPRLKSRCGPSRPAGQSKAKQPIAYVRETDLPKLLPLWPWELEVRTPHDHMRLLARLRRALRAERQRGICGHWTYDLSRHAQLLRAYRAEAQACLHNARRDRHASR